MPCLVFFVILTIHCYLSVSLQCSSVDNLFCMQVQEECKIAGGICKVSKPSENTKKLLSKLFPGSGVKKSLPTKMPFDPSDVSVAKQSKAKKKAAVPKLASDNLICSS